MEQDKGGSEGGDKADNVDSSFTERREVEIAEEAKPSLPKRVPGSSVWPKLAEQPAQPVLSPVENEDSAKKNEE